MQGDPGAAVARLCWGTGDLIERDDQSLLSNIATIEEREKGGREAQRGPAAFRLASGLVTFPPKGRCASSRIQQMRLLASARRSSRSAGKCGVLIVTWTAQDKDATRCSRR